MLIRRPISTAVITIALAMTLTACGDEDTSGIPTADTPAPSVTPSPTPTWAEDLTDAEIAEYEKALARLAAYEQRSEPLWAAGKATSAAQEIFRDYWVNWSIPFYQLQQSEKVGVTTKGTPKVLWSRPTKIVAYKGGVQVTLEQCIDPTTITVRIPDGATTEGQAIDYPYVRTVVMEQMRKKLYRVGELLDANLYGFKAERCSESS